MKKTKIIHLPTTVGGNSIGISRAEKILGFDSKAIALESNYLSYDLDEIIYKRNESKLIKIYKRIKYILTELRSVDIVHYNFGTTFFPMKIFVLENSKYKVLRILLNYLIRPLIFWDMKLLKLLGKKIFVTFQGDDARQGDMLKTLYPGYNFLQELDYTYYSAWMDKYKRYDIKVWNKWADKIFSVNPDLMNVLPERTKFIGYAHVEARRENYRDFINEKFTIVHAPTHRQIKGTKYILEAFNKLKSNYDFEFILVENMSNQEALNCYKNADLLIDQLNIGWYGGVAIEAMSFGTPVVCYVREEDLKFIPTDMVKDLPVINANRFTIYEVLKGILEDKESLRSLRKQSFEYVEKWHNPIKLTKIMNDLG